MSKRPVIIGNIVKGSIAEEAGIEKGDRIVSINGEKIKDIFDYKFLTTDEELRIRIEKKNGETPEIWEIDIEKDEYEDIGIEFENPLVDKAKRCANKCIFCFIDQLPPGMRDTLYFKDDDSRLSFLTGNYITLTNMDNKGIDRIVKYRMSPVNVSVHTTRPELRAYMLNNRFACNIMEKLKRLVDGEISVNCQIVLCRGINDGKELDKTLADLTGLSPGIKSISVVPAGITAYREGLHELKPYECESANEVVTRMGKWQQRMLETHGSRIVYVADEFYIASCKEIPDYAEYEDFPQIENGVGLLALLKHEFHEYLREIGRMGGKDRARRKISIATGEAAFRYINEFAKILEKSYDYLRADVYEIKNIFFGNYITVAGLLTGADIIRQLKGENLGDGLFITKSMLKSSEPVFLDDITTDMLEKELNVKVITVDNSGRDFIDKVLGRVGKGMG